MSWFTLKNKSPETKNRLVIILAVFCTLTVVALWLFILSITKPKTSSEQAKPFQEIKNQISQVIGNSKLEKISESKTELKNTLETLPTPETTPGQGTVSSTP